MTAVKKLSADAGQDWNDQIFTKTGLFCDETGTTYAKIMDTDDSWKVVPIRGRAIRKIIIRKHMALYGFPPTARELKELLDTADAFADIGEKRRMHLRVAGEKHIIYYSLGDDFGNTVEISPGSWTVLQEPPVFFRKYPVGAQQVLPQLGSTLDPELLFNYVNIVDPGERLLYLVYLISCLVPDIAHPAAMMFGGPGAAKSTGAMLLKALIDPSPADLVKFPGTEADLAQLFSHNYLCAFDNLAKISRRQSDMLCTAVTGGNYMKRTPFSDQDDTVFSYKGCMILTGIHLVAEEPDLLDRSLLFELQKIDKTQRKAEKEFWAAFETDRPQILGWIFDTLAEALRVFPSITLDSAPRMADFYKWGIAITEALGRDREEFFAAFDANRAKINQAILDSNSLAADIIDFMATEEKWEGTLTLLLNTLIRRYDSRQLPKAPNQLSKQLKMIAQTLGEVGVQVLWGKDAANNVTKVTLRRI